MSSIKAFHMLGRLPRMTLANVHERNFPKKNGKTRGKGATTWGGKGPLHFNRQNPVGYDSAQTPTFMKFPIQKWAKDRFDISYVPMTLHTLQLMVDTDRIDTSVPLDITQLNNTAIFRIETRMEHGGIMLEEEGLDCFCATVNLEVQFASEASIAAVERMGGTITTAYYDPYSLSAALEPFEFFEKGLVIPRRMLPPQKLIEYYTDPRNRGYLSDPELVAKERLKLSQKYGYPLVDLNESPQREMLSERKDPRQVFYGLEPGWLVNLADKVIVKPTDPELKDYYAS